MPQNRKKRGGREITPGISQSPFLKLESPKRYSVVQGMFLHKHNPVTPSTEKYTLNTTTTTQVKPQYRPVAKTRSVHPPTPMEQSRKETGKSLNDYTPCAKHNKTTKHIQSEISHGDYITPCTNQITTTERNQTHLNTIRGTPNSGQGQSPEDPWPGQGRNPEGPCTRERDNTNPLCSGQGQKPEYPCSGLGSNPEVPCSGKGREPENLCTGKRRKSNSPCPTRL